MGSIYFKTAAMLLAIATGFMLKKSKILSAADARVLSKVIINVTLPCVIISNMNGTRISIDLVGAIIAGFVVNTVLVTAALALTKNSSKEERCVYLFSIPLFNISGFAVPMMHNFVSERSIAALLLFNIGTAIFTYVVTPYLAGTLCFNRKANGISNGFKTISQNTPAMVNCAMLLLCLLNISLPDEVISLIKPLSDANTALAMLSIGMLFSLESGIGKSCKVIFFRLLFAAVIGLIIWFLPVPLGEARKMLIIVLFVPMVSCAPLLALEQGYEGPKVAVVNSTYLPISVLITTVLLGFLY